MSKKIIAENGTPDNVRFAHYATASVARTRKRDSFSKRFLKQKKKRCLETPLLFLVRKTGLEPVRCKPHAPQTCASASSATSAFVVPDDFMIILQTESFVNRFLKNIFYFFEFFNNRSPRRLKRRGLISFYSLTITSPSTS